MAQIFSLKNSKFFSGLKKNCAIVPTITTPECILHQLLVRVSSDVLVAFLYFDTSGKYQNMEKPLKH